MEIVVEHTCERCNEPFPEGVSKKRKLCNKCSIALSAERCRKKAGLKGERQRKYYGEDGWMSSYLKGS